MSLPPPQHVVDPPSMPALAPEARHPASAGPPPGPKTIGQFFGGLSLAAGIALLGALVMAVGSVGPWVDTFLGSRSGTAGGGDGTFTLGAAVVAFVLVLGMATQRGGRLSPILAALAGLGAGIVAAIDLVEINDQLAGAEIGGTQLASAGWGIYAVIVGAVVVVAAVVAADKQRR